MSYEDDDDMANVPMDDFYDGSDEITSEQWQEACWVVISAYFDEKVSFFWKIRKKWRKLAFFRWKLGKLTFFAVLSKKISIFSIKKNLNFILPDFPSLKFWKFVISSRIFQKMKKNYFAKKNMFFSTFSFRK